MQSDTIRSWNNLLCNPTRFELLEWKTKRPTFFVRHMLAITKTRKTARMWAKDRTSSVFCSFSIVLCVGRKKKRMYSTNTFWISAHIFVDIFYPIDFNCLRPLDQNAHYNRKWDEYRRNIYKLLHLTALHFSLALRTQFFFLGLIHFSSSLRCRCVVLVLVVFFYWFRLFFSLQQQFYRCDVILNQIKNCYVFFLLFLHCSTTVHENSDGKCAQAHRQLLNFEIFLHRFILTLHEHNFQSCFLALRCNGTRVFETVKNICGANERKKDRSN